MRLGSSCSTHPSEVERLAAFPGVEGVTINFAIPLEPRVVKSIRFTADLVRAAGACGVSLKVSQYAIGNAD
jgi:hypothetical protein